MDLIFISELRLDVRVGVYDWEREAPQKIQFDLEIGLPGARAGTSERLEDTIDYAAVVTRIEQSAADRHFPLLEGLAERVATLVLEEFRAPWVRVSVAKLGAHRAVRRLGVTIERGTRTGGR